MPDHSQSQPIVELHAALDASVGELLDGRSRPGTPPTLERPKRSGFGDYSTNAALLLAPILGDKPREVAERLQKRLGAHLGGSVDKIEVAGPGFLNLFLSDAWHVDAAQRVVGAGDSWAAGGAAEGERILVEFVSANPTGPMHVGHARNAAYGDSLARILEWRGHAVHREFYVNDFGSQVRKLGESILARARGEEVPEGGYQGDYVAELAAEIPDAAGRDVAELATRGVDLMVERAEATLDSFRVSFDSWYREHKLHEGEPSLVSHAFDVLQEQGRSYRSEGALWLRTSDFGDDKDRVLERSSGDHTYFASDIAYHQEKRERGFDRLIDVWGADHHGYIARMHAAFQALGGDPERFEMLIMQFVHLIEKGSRAQMSKRSGQFVTLDELMTEIGVDAARWFLLQRSHDTTIDLDLDLARSESADNPVYYVQYAHARISSVLGKLADERVREALAADLDASLELDAAERELIKKLLAFPAELAEAEARRAPHRVASYALELAQSFTAFYRDCHVVGAEPRTRESLRIALCVASRTTIARSLDLLGVSAPESM